MKDKSVKDFESKIAYHNERVEFLTRKMNELKPKPIGFSYKNKK